MWYVVEIIFAEKPTEPQESTICESCDVLFEAASTLEACDKAKIWADEHIIDSKLHFLGISRAWDLEEKRPDDGSEIAGEFYEENDPWGRKDELIPHMSELDAIKWEQAADIPVKDIFPEDELARVIDMLERIHGDDEP